MVIEHWLQTNFEKEEEKNYDKQGVTAWISCYSIVYDIIHTCINFYSASFDRESRTKAAKEVWLEGVSQVWGVTCSDTCDRRHQNCFAGTDVSFLCPPPSPSPPPDSSARVGHLGWDFCSWCKDLFLANHVWEASQSGKQLEGLSRCLSGTLG